MQIEYGIPYNKYAAMDGINASSIVAGQTSMLHMRHAMTKGERKETPAMRWGTIAHAAVLEPVRFAETATVWTGKVRRGKEWDNFLADAPDPALTLTPDEHEKALRMASVVHSKRDAVDILNGADNEVVLTWQHEHYGNGKTRFDVLNATRSTPVISDYKTTASIIPERFWRTAYNMAYHVKMGWYAHGYEAATGVRPDIKLIVQEQDAPFDCWVCHVPDHIVKMGEDAAVEIAKRYHACEVCNQFSGVVPFGVIDYELPRWVDTGETWTVGGEENE